MGGQFMGRWSRREENLRKKQAEASFRESIEHIDRGQVKSAADAGQAKVQGLRKNVPHTLKALWSDIGLLLSMVRDYMKGRYRNIPFSSIAAAAAALLYFASPLDAIPDFIPALGYIDDAFIVALCLKMLRRDLAKYQRWKDAKIGG
jgi:uncharacterized membrane protein YkvA (DUF1232 family)